MSATNRTIEAEIVALDTDDPDARKKLEAEAAKIATESGLDAAAVLAALHAIRARKRKRKRSKGDFYETPPWVVDEIAKHLPISGEPVVLDAGAGTGAITARLAALNPKAEIVGVEKNADLVTTARARSLYSAEFVVDDFLKSEADWTIARPDLVVMNPPFSRALEFVTRALEIVKRGGTVASLARLNWLAGRARVEFLRKHTPDVFVLAKRPSFTGRGTDATEYAWLVWGPETIGKVTILPCLGGKGRARAARKASTPAQA